MAPTWAGTIRMDLGRCGASGLRCDGCSELFGGPLCGQIRRTVEDTLWKIAQFYFKWFRTLCPQVSYTTGTETETYRETDAVPDRSGVVAF